MDDLQFKVRLNSISVISGQWECDNERLPRLSLKRFQRESNPRSPDQLISTYFTVLLGLRNERRLIQKAHSAFHLLQSAMVSQLVNATFISIIGHRGLPFLYATYPNEGSILTRRGTLSSWQHYYYFHICLRSRGEPTLIAENLFVWVQLFS